jgi:hypothetical protein
MSFFTKPVDGADTIPRPSPTLLQALQQRHAEKQAELRAVIAKLNCSAANAKTAPARANAELARVQGEFYRVQRETADAEEAVKAELAKQDVESHR